MKKLLHIAFALVLSIYTIRVGTAQVNAPKIKESKLNDTSYLKSPIVNYTEVPFDIRNNKFQNSKAVEILQVPIILTTISLATIPYKNRLQNIRETYTPDFHMPYDDYIKYLPATVMFGVKAFGVEGKSSWGRMLTADGFSIATMIVLVNGIKYTAKVKRPDSDSRNSYPSGHTATSFMTATMLHKEYGQVSKWYSIGGYGVATLTGATRILNNRHWASDIIFGAAVGILSTELGYLFADLIFKNKGLNDIPEKQCIWFGDNYRPSFIGLYTAVNALPDSFDNYGSKIKLSNSARFGLEGAWYMNKHVGFGAEVTASTADVEIEGNQMGMISGLAGGFLSYPLSNRWRIGAKALAGANFITQPLNKLVRIADCTATAATGINVSYLTNQNLGFRVFADYRYHFNLINTQGANELNFGVSINMMLGKVKY